MLKKTYFVSDLHLGADARHTSREREQIFVKWLHLIAPQAEAIYIVGDLFDFWFEYKKVVPKGYSRVLGALAELVDGGLPIYFFTGNHDMWIFNYFEQELAIPTYRQPILRQINHKIFFIGHGDGLGPGDHGYKFLKKVFANPFCQWLFERLHPNIGIGMAEFWSGKSRSATGLEEQFLGPENEWLIQYANRKLDIQFADYFVFGHRHLPIDFTLKNGRSRYINLGDWLRYYTYAVFDGNDIQLEFYHVQPGKIYGS